MYTAARELLVDRLRVTGFSLGRVTLRHEQYCLLLAGHGGLAGQLERVAVASPVAAFALGDAFLMLASGRSLADEADRLGRRAQSLPRAGPRGRR